MILHNGQPPIRFKIVPRPRSSEPSLWQKAKNLTRAAGRVGKAAVKGAKIAAAPEEIERRMAICQGCEFFTGKSCKKCGCNINFKARLETEHCPIGKW
jgi:hypothetical protein